MAVMWFDSPRPPDHSFRESFKKRVEDVHLGVESYQKCLNLTKPQMIILNIKLYPAYTTCPRSYGLVYEDKGGVKTFMGLCELHKFCDGTLIDVRDQLVNMIRLNQVGKKYKSLNDRKWSDRDDRRSKTMLKKIKFVLKEQRKLRRLEGYVGGRPKTGDIRLFVKPE
ncbi:hypothetical protein Tco_0587054 [Tanacetum coccineum]